MQSTGEAMKIQMSTETKTLLETTGGGNFIIEPRCDVDVVSYVALSLYRTGEVIGSIPDP
jgi:hypothetical protein